MVSTYLLKGERSYFSLEIADQLASSLRSSSTWRKRAWQGYDVAGDRSIVFVGNDEAGSWADAVRLLRFKIAVFLISTKEYDWLAGNSFNLRLSSSHRVSCSRAP